MPSTLSAVFAGSGRLVHADQDFGRLQDWARSGDGEALRSGEVYAEIEDAIASATIISKSMTEAFRGRTPPFIGSTPTSAEMGPPPSPEHATAGRYNPEGAAVLYCATTEDGVRRELQERQGNVWSQRLHIPTNELRVADFRVSAQPAHHIVNNLFWFAELAGVEGYPDQSLSRLVATVVFARFDGMLVPGVRGDKDVQYENLIIFKPEVRWKNWLASAAPQRL